MVKKERGIIQKAKIVIKGTILFQALYKAGEKKIGTDESVFNQIIALQSFEQLQQVFWEYSKLSNRSIEQAISSEFSGDIQAGLLTIGMQVYGVLKYICLTFS